MRKSFDWLCWGVFIGCLVPLAIRLYEIFTGKVDLFGTGVKPVFLQFGYVGLVLLIASLACTPIRLVFGVSWPAKLRKMLGLFGFLYVCLHAIVYTGFEEQLISGLIGASKDGKLNWSWLTSEYASEIKRVFLALFTPKNLFMIFGVAAFLMLIPLAVTSTNGMVRRLGGKRWQMLHRLAYPIAILGVIHFYMGIKSKDAKLEAWILGGIVAMLLGVRLWKTLTSRKSAKAAA